MVTSGSDDETLAPDPMATAPAPLDDTAPADAAPAAKPRRGRRRPSVGDRIEHYVVGRILGRGAMGLVVEARDTELARDVALKLLLHAGKADAKPRLQREAQAMAQLSHPNVVAVHGVGECEYGVYIAMELVRGDTLEAWCEAQPRPWGALVEVFIAAGEGLLAAHRAGIVHRDFKPANVMVDADGRARVTDFGLAGAQDRAWSTVSGEDIDVDQRLTQTGQLMGTPRYMAPEQFGGLEVDARADQFALAVSLYRSLYGRYPFEGESVPELMCSVVEGEPLRPPARAEAPGALWPILRRALQGDPEDRYPTLAPMLAALRRVLDARRRHRWWMAVGVIALGGLGGGVALTTSLRAEPCDGVQAPLEQAWDGTPMAQIEQAMRSTDDPGAEDTIERVRVRLDDYVQRWRTSAQAVCEATHVEGRQSDTLLDTRMHCLDRGRLELLSLVELLGSRGEVEVLRKAVNATAGLPSPEDCQQLETDVEGGAREQLQTAQRLARLDTLTELGLYDESLALGRALLDEVETARGRGHAAHLVGTVLSEQGHHAEALEHLREAGRAMAEAGDYERRAGIDLTVVTTLRDDGKLSRAEGALELARFSVYGARASPRRRIELEQIEGNLLDRGLRHTEALERYEAALALAEDLGDQLEIARSVGYRAEALAVLGRVDEAHREAKRCLRVRIDLLGEYHPSTLIALRRVSTILIEGQRFDQAREPNIRAQAAYERVEGPRGLNLAPLLAEAAIIDVELGDYSTAVTKAEQALQIYRHHGKGQSPAAAFPLQLMSIAHSHLEQHPQAVDAATLVLSIREAAWGKDHGALTTDWLTYGEVLREAGRSEPALRAFERALELAPPDSPPVPYALVGIGKSMTDLGRPEGLDFLERGVAHTAWPDDPADKAEASFELARAREARGDTSAISLARTAERELRGPRARRVHARVVAWLADRGVTVDDRRGR